MQRNFLFHSCSMSATGESKLAEFHVTAFFEQKNQFQKVLEFQQFLH